MPRESLQSINPAPQSAGSGLSRANELTQVVARPAQTPAGMAPVDSPLAGLVNGLSEFYPHLNKFAEVKDHKDGQDAALSGEAAARTAFLDPANASQLPESMPADANPAFRSNFDQAYKQVLGQRLGIQSSAAIQAEYDKQKMSPDFNVDAFLADQLHQQTGGVQDPTIANEVAKSNIELSRQIRAEDNKIKLSALKDATTSNIAAVTNQLIAGSGGNPEALASSFHSFLNDNKAAWQQYFTRPEVSEMLVKQITAQSVSDKGTPALFDALDKVPDPATGKTIAESNPNLALQIAEGRKAAERAQDQRIEKDAQPALLQERTDWEQRVARGELIPVEVLANSIGVGKQFNSHEAANTFNRWQHQQVGANDDLNTTLSWMRAGMGYLATPAQQKAAADYVTTPLVNQIMGMVNDPAKQGQLNDAMALFAKVHADSNLTIGNEVLTRFIDGLTKIPPDASGSPSPRFAAAAAMFRAMPPTVRDLYFKDDAQTLFSHYTREVDAGLAPATAYQQAYAGISADAKEREREITKDPTWAPKMLKTVQSAVDGLRFTWKDLTPFASNMPSNATIADAWGLRAAKQYLMDHPNMGEDDLKAFLKKSVQDNFVHDTNTNMLIGVPPSVGQTGLKAIEWYQDGLVKKYGADARPTLVYMGNGNYQVMTQNPISNKETLTWDQLRRQHVENTTLTDADRAAITEMNQKAAKGTLSATDLQTYAPLMSKARTLGLEDKLPMRKMNDALDTSMRSALANIPKLALGGATNVLGPTPQAANDRASQQEITARFLQNAQQTAHIKSGSAISLASALITQGEGVVLKAAPDPAGGAGNNIGMGYNLNANAATLKEDFRRAGIPVESIEAIKAGKASITDDQAQRLLSLTVPRYMDKAKSVIESKYPGMWDKMTPHQQAVVTDVAYQVKDFSKFGPSIDALFSGDQSKIDSAFQVRYTDHKGVTRVDTRRNNLRANLLKGTQNFMAVAMNN